MAKQDPEAKKKKQLILILILIPILGWFVYSNLIAGPKKKKEEQRKARLEAERVEKERQEKAGPPGPQKKRKSAGRKTPQKNKLTDSELPPLDNKLARMQEQVDIGPWGRDPFNPAPTPMEEALETTDWKEFKLDGVIPHPERGAAFINGELIGAGESYRGYLLLRVEDYKIILEKGGQQFELIMSEE